MGFLHNLRYKLHLRQLSKEAQTAQNQHRSIHLQEAETVGFLFDATDEQVQNSVLKYAKHLSAKGKKVALLGFFDSKKLPTGDFPFPFFGKKELTWTFVPQLTSVSEFMNRRFDLLLTVARKPVTALEYISTLSKSTFRVGPFSENNLCYDLMIDTKQNQDVDNLLRQMEFFLTKMKPQYEAATA
jgi:hypothetical protein